MSAEEPVASPGKAGREGPGESSALERVARWAVIIVAGVAAVWIIYLTAAAFVPRWWAQRVGERVDGSFSAGVYWGLGQGFVFTALALAVLWQVRRGFLAWWGRLIVVGLALLVAMPNLLTLFITIGSSSGAHAGQRILDVRAPAYQWASLWGALLGVVAVLVVQWVLWRLRQRRRQVTDLSSRLDQAPEPPNDDTSI